MADEREMESTLRDAFASLRANDAREAPSFSALFAAAQQQAGDAPSASPASAPSPVATRRSRRALWWLAAPLLTAAGLGAVWLSASRRADREFDQTVTAWSRTTRQALRTPTDGLLSVPGSEYLHSMPAIGSGGPVVRSGS